MLVKTDGDLKNATIIAMTAIGDIKANTIESVQEINEKGSTGELYVPKFIKVGVGSKGYWTVA